MTCFKSAVVILILLIPAISSALRCGSDLVLKGDRKIEVLKSCGEPDFIEEWEEETVTHVTDVRDTVKGDLLIGRKTRLGRSNIEHIAEWTYNFGSRRFIRYLTFVNGKLKKIEDGPKGTDRDILSGSYLARCGLPVEKGDRRIEVILKCGDPYSIEYFWEEQFSDVSSAVRTRRFPEFTRKGTGYEKEFIKKSERVYKQYRKMINIEEWSYNFGPTRFMYFIRFENGRVANIEDGDYGF